MLLRVVCPAACAIKKDSKLTPWQNDMLKPWDQLSEEEKKALVTTPPVTAARASAVRHERKAPVEIVPGHYGNISRDSRTMRAHGPKPYATPCPPQLRGYGLLPADHHACCASRIDQRLGTLRP